MRQQGCVLRAWTSSSSSPSEQTRGGSQTEQAGLVTSWIVAGSDVALRAEEPLFIMLLLLYLLLLDDQQRLLLLSLRTRRIARGGLTRTGDLLVAALVLFPLSQLVDHSFGLHGCNVEADVAAHVAFEVGSRLKETNGGGGTDRETTAPSRTGDDEPTANIEATANERFSVLLLTAQLASQCHDRSDMFIFCLCRQRILLLSRQFVRRVIDVVAAHGHVQRIDDAQLVELVIQLSEGGLGSEGR